MDINKETPISQANGSQVGGSWIPATPAKFGAPKTHPSSTKNQEIQLIEAHLLEFDKLNQENVSEKQPEQKQSSSESFEEAEEQVAFWGSTNVNDENMLFKEIDLEHLEQQSNSMRFTDLLKLVDSESVNVSEMSSTSFGLGFGSLFQPQIEGDLLGSSSTIDTNLSLGSISQSGNAPQYGVLFDLNSPAKTTEVEIMGKNISHFAPLTPSTANSVIDKGVFDAINEVQNGSGQLLAEGHDLDMGKAQQKPKRKKVRPKVVREDQPKRARKTSTPETPKRKYVRKKKLNTPSATPPEQQYSIINDPKTVRCAAKTCRRSLNFEFESQAREESSLWKRPSCFGPESRIAAEKTRVDTQLRNQDSGPLTPSKCEDFLPYNFSDEVQNLTRGQCQLVFSNETHDKEAASEPKFSDQINTHSAPRNPASFFTRGKCRLAFSNETHDKEAASKPKFNDQINTHTAPRNPASFLHAHHTVPVSEDHIGGFAMAYKQRSSKEVQSLATSNPMLTAIAKNEGTTTATAMQESGSSDSAQPGTCMGDLPSSLPATVGIYPLDPSFMQSMNSDQEQSALVPYLYHMRYQQQNELIAYRMRCQEAKQLVVYQRDGTVVPFEGPSGPVRRRKPRAKVDLDEETTRVWNLLIQDINSEGVDGTEDKAKWWEEERKVFRGRADSFIARMHLIQGDRRFSKWKGSVVDSVVGVFLTQNVSDHLSSSAFMSLAARFPLKSKTNNEPPKEESTTMLIQEPVVNVHESSDSILCPEVESNPTGRGKCPLTVQYMEYTETKEAVNSIESSQNSADSSITQIGDTEEKLIGGSQYNNFGCYNSFIQQLEMAEMPMLNGVHNAEKGSDGPNACLVSTISSNYNLHLNHNSRYSSNVNEEICACEESALSAESTIQDTVQIINDMRSNGDKTGKKKSKEKTGKVGKEKENPVDWDSLRKQAETNGKRERTAETMDSLDWDAIRCADVNIIADTIKERGMNNRLAERIKDFLNRLVRDHGSIDLEWLRDIPPDKAKEYLLSVRGLGLKSVECVRLLTLHHLAFPVDTNVGRIAVRLGWVPLQPLPESIQLHLLDLYPVLESIQKYLWPRLCKLDQRTLYELHYQMITFGKVFCTKSRPNCNSCPLRGECRHFASAFASARLALPAPEKEKGALTEVDQHPTGIMGPLQLPAPAPQTNIQVALHSKMGNCAPIIEEPATPEPMIEEPATPESIQTQVLEIDIEDTLYDDPEEIPTIKLNLEEFTQNLQNYMENNMELQEGELSKALVALTPNAASIPVRKLKNVNQLRTEHQVYELPDTHPLLEGFDERQTDDPCPYLLAIWTPGETAESIQPPEGICSSQESGKLCDEKTCFSCNNIREANSSTVRGTILIPCRTANRGSFPLNGTYFQVNEVFADHESSLNPIDVPRAWIWNLPRRTVYFGTSIPTIFKGLTTEGIQYCFWRGFVCVRGFDRKTRAPRPLMARLHFPASRMKAKVKTIENKGHSKPSTETAFVFSQTIEEPRPTETELVSNKTDLVFGKLGDTREPQGLTFEARENRNVLTFLGENS